MSGPFGVSITVISGQQQSGEIVVAASAFLSMGYQSITSISSSLNVRENFLIVLEAFARRENIGFYNQPEYYLDKLIEPNDSNSTKVFFWLALDKKGYSIAKNIFIANRVSPDERVYKSVRKVNLLEQEVASPPRADISYEFWRGLSNKLFKLSLDYSKPNHQETRSSFINNQIPLLPSEKEWYLWCKSLYQNLMPWQKTIEDIQSDLS